jgi:hypothetical protein
MSLRQSELSQVSSTASKEAKERRADTPPSDAFLARVCAVVDFLISSGLSEGVATQILAQRLTSDPTADGDQEVKVWSARITEWRIAFRDGKATEKAVAEYHNVAAAIESIAPQQRVERVLESELWDRRRLNLHRRSDRGCLIY